MVAPQLLTSVNLTATAVRQGCQEQGILLPLPDQIPSTQVPLNHRLHTIRNFLYTLSTASGKEKGADLASEQSVLMCVSM